MSVGKWMEVTDNVIMEVIYMVVININYVVQNRLNNSTATATRKGQHHSRINVYKSVEEVVQPTI